MFLGLLPTTIRRLKDHLPSPEVPEFAGVARRSQIAGYLLAVVSVGLAFMLRLGIDPWLGDQSPYETFLVAVAVTGLFAGIRPALFATFLGALVAYVCFVPPRYRWGFATVSDAAAFSVYLLAAAAVIALTKARNKAAENAERALTQQIEAERSLLDAESLFRHFMDHSSACAYLRDDTGRCVYANAVATRELGLLDGGLHDAPAQPTISSRLLEQDQQVLRTSEPMEVIDNTASPQGERYWLTRRFPFVNQAGQRLVGGISFEITARMKADEILRKNERLASAGQMASLLAHEINNPLGGLTNLMFLLSQQSLPPVSRDFVVRANDALERINRIVAMTLGIYYEKVAPTRVNICQVLSDAADTLLAVERFRTIRLERELNCDATFAASLPRMRQLFTNLLANAMESGAETVRIRVRPGRDWRLNRRSGVLITIADDGCGIRSELRQRLFEPFLSTKPEKGAGLGLWSSKAIVLRNDGSIRLRSSVGPAKTGTCVRIFLPTGAARFYGEKFHPASERTSNSRNALLG
jgi:signal transduction histidine kinase